jgi:DNA-binding response OmpR family regulator
MPQPPDAASRNAASTRIVVVDDDPGIRELATLYLRKEGFDVSSASDGASAVEAITAREPALVVLDVMMPGKNGFDICRELRQRSNVPIIMLTARDEEIDKIVGLEIGADDYLTKPFSPRELVARVKAILRRAENGQREPATHAVRVGGVTVDKQRREVKSGGKEIALRTKEFDLLAALADNAGIVLTREQLLDRVWGYNFYGETRTVDVHVQHVRAKLAGTGLGIMTVRGVGYKLVEDTDAAAPAQD